MGIPSAAVLAICREFAMSPAQFWTLPAETREAFQRMYDRYIATRDTKQLIELIEPEITLPPAVMSMATDGYRFFRRIETTVIIEEVSTPENPNEGDQPYSFWNGGRIQVEGWAPEGPDVLLDPNY